MLKKPEIVVEEFLGIDSVSDPERLALGAFQDLRDWTVDINGNLTFPGSVGGGVAFTQAATFAMHWYRAQDKLVAIGRNDPSTGRLEWCNRDLSSATALETYGTTTTAGAEIVHIVEMNEILYFTVWEEVLRAYDPSLTPGSRLYGPASADTDLDGDQDTTDNLYFHGCGSYQGHLMGWGFGDLHVGTKLNETYSLGSYRPEIMRWSHLGSPEKYRPENWIIVGTVGLPIITAREAFGRYVCFKQEGIWLLYGDLEQNFPQLEQLQFEDGAAPGIVSARAAEVYNGVLYWCSPAGPMRWTGGRLPEYIGQPIQNSLTAEFRNHETIVCAWPEENLILFFGHNDPVYGSPYPGGPQGAPGVEYHYAWLWDTIRERWAGTMNVLGSGAVHGVSLPDEDYVYRPIIGKGIELKSSPASTNPRQFTTGDIRLNGKKGGVLRGIVLEGDFGLQETNGDWTFTVVVDGTSYATPDLFVQSATPTANAVGDGWYWGGAFKLWDGSAWVQQYGLQKGIVRFPFNVRCKKIGLSASYNSATTAMNTTIRRMAIQVDPAR